MVTYFYASFVIEHRGALFHPAPRQEFRVSRAAAIWSASAVIFSLEVRTTM